MSSTAQNPTPPTTSARRKFLNGTVTGVVSTYVFNPFDRALYLAMRDRTRFLDPRNWARPYQGVTTALYSRTLGYGIYFSLYDSLRQNMGLSTLKASVVTGCVIPLANHPINVVKMYNWNRDTSEGLVPLAKEMHRKYGPRIFALGLQYTMVRDVAFTTLFYGLTERFNRKKSFTRDVVLASTATALSSPLNYFRNSLYFSFNQHGRTGHVTFGEIFRDLQRDVMGRGTTGDKVRYLFQDRFCVGWGTLRVGVGMALSKKIYEAVEGW